MATPTKSKKGKKSTTSVTRIKATDSAAPAKTKAKKTKQPASSGKTATSTKDVKDTKAKAPSKKSRRSPLGAIRKYFAGAWDELKQVRWPDRRSTWAMTGALIIFTLAFIVVILLIDYGFSWLFKLIIGTN